jgi:hypothetical protein
MSPLAIFGTVLAIAATAMFFMCRSVSHLDETRAEIDAVLGDDAMALCRDERPLRYGDDYRVGERSAYWMNEDGSAADLSPSWPVKPLPITETDWDTEYRALCEREGM